MIIGDKYTEDLLEFVSGLRSEYNIHKLVGISRVTSYIQQQQSDTLIMVVASSDECNSLLEMRSFFVNEVTYVCLQNELTLETVTVPSTSARLPSTSLIYGINVVYKLWLSASLQDELCMLKKVLPRGYFSKITGIFLVLDKQTQISRNFYFLTSLNNETSNYIMNLLNLSAARSVLQAEKGLVVLRREDLIILNKHLINKALLLCNESIALNWLVSNDERRVVFNRYLGSLPQLTIEPSTSERIVKSGNVTIVVKRKN